MRIAVIATHQGIVGGAETYVRWLLPELVSRGHRVAFGFEYECSDENRALDRNVEPLERWLLRQTDALGKLTTFSPDVVYLQGLDDAALEAELSKRFPCVLFAHSFYGACATGLRRHKFPELRPCERQFGPACLAANYVMGCGGRRPDRLLKAFITQHKKAETVRRCAAIILASQYMKDVYEREGIDATRLHVIHIPTPGMRPDLEPPTLRPAQNRLLFIGRITHVKGLDHAVRATCLASTELKRKLTLCIAGEGPELKKSVSLAKRLGVDVNVHGWVDGEGKLALMRSADLMILPSTWPEPFGLVGIEAGCVGLPTVAYGIGGTTDWLRPGESGEIANYRSQLRPEHLGRAIVKALSSEDHLNTLRLGAWRMATHFHAKEHVTELEKVFKSVAKHANPALTNT